MKTKLGAWAMAGVGYMRWRLRQGRTPQPVDAEKAQAVNQILDDLAQTKQKTDAEYDQLMSQVSEAAHNALNPDLIEGKYTVSDEPDATDLQQDTIESGDAFWQKVQRVVDEDGWQAVSKSDAP